MESVQLRFDDEPARSARTATSIEEKIDAIVIGGSDLEQPLHASRLRTRVLTRVSGVHEDDLDLAGMADAYKNIMEDCPGEPMKPASADVGVQKPSPKSGCFDRAGAELKIKGLTTDEITDICDR